MGKHRFDPRNDQAWGGPDLALLADSSSPTRHTPREPDNVTVPLARPAGDGVVRDGRAEA